MATSDEKYGPWLQPFGDKGAGRSVRRQGGGFRAFATNYRMSESQAAVVAGQLTRLEATASTRARLGNLLTEQIKDIPGIVPHDAHPEDRAVYWFYMFRVNPDAFRINRADFTRTLRAEGVPAGGGYIGRPLYGEPVFQEHGFFAGGWPVKEFGLTEMMVVLAGIGKKGASTAWDATGRHAGGRRSSFFSYPPKWDWTRPVARPFESPANNKYRTD
ncbi:MAG: DegT/DnrJ/EryC1/StrS family aminotransferase [Opitutales bacterium]